MGKVFLSMAAIGFAALMGSCGTGAKTVADVDLSGEWNIVDINGVTLGGDARPFLGVDMAEKRIYGNAGCNRMMGGLEYDSVQPGKVRFTSVATTRMMCPEMETEQKVLAALDKVVGYSGTEESLSLVDAEGNSVMTVEKRRQPEVTVDSLEGEWTIVSVGSVSVEGMENVPFLAFNVAEQRVHGNAGCNIINGGFSQEEGQPASLKFSQMISTMMACPDMDTERKVLEALDKVRGFSAGENGGMNLLDEKGEAVIVLSKK